MKKTYMKPAISAMDMETTAILAGSLKSVSDSRPTSDLTSDPTAHTDNQFSKEHTFDLWEE